MAVLLLPGMGANARMYAEVLAAAGNPSDWRALDWTDHRGCATLPELAGRMQEIHAIGTGDILVGSSLGGMVACEIAAQLNRRPVVLIGSCHRPDAIPTRVLAAWAAGWMRPGMLRALGAKGRGSLLARMAAESDPAFIRWSLRALHGWTGVPASALARIHSIHGLLDPLIPCHRVRPDRILVGGGHFLALSHPRQVADFIMKKVQEIRSI